MKKRVIALAAVGLSVIAMTMAVFSLERLKKEKDEPIFNLSAIEQNRNDLNNKGGGSHGYDRSNVETSIAKPDKTKIEDAKESTEKIDEHLEKEEAQTAEHMMDSSEEEISVEKAEESAGTHAEISGKRGSDTENDNDNSDRQSNREKNEKEKNETENSGEPVMRPVTEFPVDPDSTLYPMAVVKDVENWSLEEIEDYVEKWANGELDGTATDRIRTQFVAQATYDVMFVDLKFDFRDTEYTDIVLFNSEGDRIYRPDPDIPAKKGHAYFRVPKVKEGTVWRATAKPEGIHKGMSTVVSEYKEK